MKISIKSSLVQRKFYFNLFFIFIVPQFLIGIIFDHNDKAWNEVKIWQDKNFNGNYSIVKSANPVFV